VAKILICYYTRTSNTLHMAEAVAEGVARVEGAAADVRSVEQTKPTDLLEYDGIILGSPVYYGTMAAELKKLLDDSIVFHGGLAGKVGGAFASSANIGGGNETTILDLLKALLIHGMIVQGSARGDHYGPVAIGDVDKRSSGGCRNMGRIVAELAVTLHG
jgi:NAD(P)H dehydrogenase (quinone)